MYGIIMIFNYTCVFYFQMSRRIYFCGSIRGGRQDAELYARLITMLKGYGTVLTEHVGDTSFTEKGNMIMIAEEYLIWVFDDN